MFYKIQFWHFYFNEYLLEKKTKNQTHSVFMFIVLDIIYTQKAMSHRLNYFTISKQPWRYTNYMSVSFTYFFLFSLEVSLFSQLLKAFTVFSFAVFNIQNDVRLKWSFITKYFGVSIQICTTCGSSHFSRITVKEYLKMKRKKNIMYHIVYFHTLDMIVFVKYFVACSRLF